MLLCAPELMFSVDFGAIEVFCTIGILIINIIFLFVLSSLHEMFSSDW